MYYLVDHLTIDQLNRFSLPNTKRFMYFLFFYWLQFLYHQSYGMLLSVIIFQHSHSSLLLITISQAIVLLFQLFNNNILVTVQRIHFQLFQIIGDYLISLRFIYDGVLYSYYGIGTCDYSLLDKHYYSIIFQRYSINPDKIFINLIPIVIICLVIYILAFLILWFRFRLKCYCINNTPQRNSKPTEPQIVPIDYGPKISYRKKSKVRIIQPIFKDDEEVEFCRNKIHIAWRSLSLFAASNNLLSEKINKSPDYILRNLNGQFRLGTMNAIIGSQSSIAKNLFLRVLSGQLKARLSKETKFFESQYISTNVCYISDNAHEHLITGITVKQSIIYASMIKNIEDDFESRLDHEEMALNILDELDLRYRAKTFVEDCSTDEQKRLALALELTALQMPNLICLDGPTEALDSTTSELLIQCIRQLNERHSLTFAISFHSTNHQILSMFDQIYCLDQNGACIYSGSSDMLSIRQHLSTILPEMQTNYPLEELLRYSCLIADQNNNQSEINDKMIKENNKKIFELDKFLSEDTINLSNGIKLNEIGFSIISVYRLGRRYRGRWLSSLWFYWIMLSATYILGGLILNGLFGIRPVLLNGCIRPSVLNGTGSCQLHRTGTKLIWEEDGFRLWDTYRYIYISNSLFLTLVLFQTTLVFYQELKVFLHEHLNGKYCPVCFQKFIIYFLFYF